MVSADAATAHVLTIRKVGGTAVKKGAILKAGLETGTKAVFSLGSMMLTCKSATFTAKVTSNPAAPGTAKESLTAQQAGKCKVTGVSGITVKSVHTLNLPYNVKVSDVAGLPVTVSGRSRTTPLRFAATVSFGGHLFTCSYKAASIVGVGSNTGSTIAISMQPFSKVGGGALCPASAMFSATFGPVRDSSVTGSPMVFVN